MVLSKAITRSKFRAFSTSRLLLKKCVPPSLSDIKVVDLDRYAQYKSAPEEFATELSECSEQELKLAQQEMSHNSLIKSFLYGSAEAQKEAAQADKSFSQHLMRGKLVHEINFHSVIPSRAGSYVQLMNEFNTKFEKQDLGRLVGAWRTVIGSDVDTYVHIWEYDNLANLHLAKQEAHSDPTFREFSDQLKEHLRSRSCEVVQEFAFWGGTAKPRALGGIFELRKYDLKPGKMIDWEIHWRRGIEYRREVMEPVGAWFTSIGPLNRVYHLWQFTDLQHRRISRERSWQQPGWAETTYETVKLLDKMESLILLPLDYSPLK